MRNNTFGDIYSFTTFGESHGQAIGVVIDGCPSGLSITDEEINTALQKRAPGRAFTSPRKEPDQGKIISGVFEGKTTGAPIAFIVENKNHDSSNYQQIKDTFRPGHAHYTYLQKYGIYDYRGGGRASARETIGRVVAGTIAKKVLASWDIETFCYLHQVGEIQVDPAKIQKRESAIFCPDLEAEEKMIHHLKSILEQGDSIGGIVAFETSKLSIGLGDPVYGKIDALLASAMMSIPASKGFEIGSGFAASKKQGSENNDPFRSVDGKTSLQSNHAGGILGGITSGEPVYGKVAFKPTSSIKIEQDTVNEIGENKTIKLSKDSRHDPCVAIRAVPIVDAMLCCVLLDLSLKNRCVKL